MAKIGKSKATRLNAALSWQQPLPKTENTAKQSPFSLALERKKKAISVVSSPENEHLQQLFRQTEKEAKSLQLHFSVVQLRHYQQALSAFMRQLVNFGFNLDYQSQHFRINRGKRKRYAIVKVIDEQAHELAQLLLQKQLPQILILEKVNKIQGLIVDLLS